MDRNRKSRLQLEILEDRQLPAVVIPLIPTRDQFGDQVLTLQRYHIAPEYYSFDGYLNQFAIFDTGSPFVAFGYYNQQLPLTDGDLVPIKVPGGAVADAIGGRIAAEVGMPGLIDVQGLGSLEFLYYDKDGNILFPPQYQANWTEEMVQQLVQPVVTPLAVGDTRIEYEIPSLAGMPFLAPSDRFVAGRAAYIDLNGVSIDFTTIQNEDRDGDGVGDYSDENPWIISIPDVQFVTPGTALESKSGESNIYRIPLVMQGLNNISGPGLNVSRNQVPVQNAVLLQDGAAQIGQRAMLFDTGSQLTTISVAMANAMGLDLNNPEMTTTIIGAAGPVDNVPGFVLDSLTLPITGGDTLQFRDVPIYVIDVPGYDGVLGTNLFGPASRMLFDPYAAGGATLSVTFFSDRPDAPPPISSSFAFTLREAGLRAVMRDPSGFPLPAANFQGGQVSGQVYHDVNRDKKFTDEDSILQSVIVFADSNNNGLRDTGEPFTESGATGLFSLSGLITGKRYTIRQEAYPGLINLDAPRTVRLKANQSVSDIVFRNVVPPPKIVSSQLGNLATSERSSVRSINLLFDKNVIISSDAISLLRNGKTFIPLSWTTNNDFGSTLVTITFPGNDIRGGSLSDGSYELRIRATGITSEDGQFLDANGNGLAGDNYKFSFHRLFGDMNGDGRVNKLDAQIVVSAFQAPSDSSYAGLDYDNNGTFDAVDNARFWFNYHFYRQQKVRLFRSGL